MADTSYYGSLNITKLVEAMAAGHSAFTQAKKKADGTDGDIYCNFNMWTNDEPNDKGQHGNLQLASHKDSVATEPRQYVGNFKKSNKQKETPAQPAEAVTTGLKEKFSGFKFPVKPTT